MASRPRNTSRRIATKRTTSFNRNGKAANQRWDAYIAAMRGTVTSVAPDVHKIDAVAARQGAAERFFTDRDQSRANRNAFHLSKMLKRQSG
jgi:hypothetical protein